MNSISQWKAFEKQRTDNLFFGDMGNSGGEIGGLFHPVQCCQYDILILPQMDNIWGFEAAELPKHWYLLVGKRGGEQYHSCHKTSTLKRNGP